MFDGLERMRSAFQARSPPQFSILDSNPKPIKEDLKGRKKKKERRKTNLEKKGKTHLTIQSPYSFAVRVGGTCFHPMQFFPSWVW